MCLDTITKVIDDPTDEVVDAWKSFDGCGDTIRSIIFKTRIPCNTWIKATPNSVFSHEDQPYESGFHACISRKDAEAYFGEYVLPVKLRKITYEGTQSGFPALVAEEMFVPRPSRTLVGQIKGYVLLVKSWVWN